MANKIKYVLELCVLGVITLGSSVGFAATCPDAGEYPYNGCSLEGLRAGGFPYFTQSVYVTLKNKKNGDFYLTASYGGVASGVSDFRVSNSVDGIYNIDSTFFQFEAKRKNDNVTGSIRIMGMLDGMSTQQTLMTADLDGVWASTGQLIGFNTMNIQCGEAILALVDCTSSEVIYLSQLQDPLDPGGAKGKYQTTGLAVTTVPVPAAVWLFGSGLIGLAGVARRRKG